ncbi:MAG: hypothetical protein ACLTAN_05090, partial [Christensenellaceae bacterium]
LPLGGKLLAKQGDEGRPNNIQAFFSKSRFILNPRSWLPLWGSCRLLPTEEVFLFLCMPSPFLTSSLPLAYIKFCSQNFLRQKCEVFPYVVPSPCPIVLAHNEAKIVSRFAASPWGEAPCKAR